VHADRHPKQSAEETEQYLSQVLVLIALRRGVNRRSNCPEQYRVTFNSFVTRSTLSSRIAESSLTRVSHEAVRDPIFGAKASTHPQNRIWYQLSTDIYRLNKKFA
jgi:hypothetical protein